MDLSPYVEALRRDVAGAAAVGGVDVARAAELVADALGPALRLVLLDLLADAASDVTAALAGPVVDVRLRGREPELVVTFPQQSEAVATPAAEDEGTSRLTLRLPETLKARAEQAAAGEGMSVNSWLVRAVTRALTDPTPPAWSAGPRRITGMRRA
jgi:hypothetical protein